MVKRKCTAKINFFQNKLLPYRETSSTEFDTVRSYYEAYHQAAQLIISNPNISNNRLRLAFPLLPIKEILFLLECGKQLKTLLSQLNTSDFAQDANQMQWGAYASEFKPYIELLKLLDKHMSWLNLMADSDDVALIYRETSPMLRKLPLSLLHFINTLLPPSEQFCIFYMMAINECISLNDTHLLTIMSQKNPVIRYALLQNNYPQVKVNEHLLATFLQLSSSNAELVISISKHPNLSERLVAHIMHCMEFFNTEINDQITHNLLVHFKTSNAAIKPLITKQLAIDKALHIIDEYKAKNSRFSIYQFFSTNNDDREIIACLEDYVKKRTGFFESIAMKSPGAVLKKILKAHGLLTQTEHLDIDFFVGVEKQNLMLKGSA